MDDLLRIRDVDPGRIERLLHVLQAHAVGHGPARASLGRSRVLREDVAQVVRDDVPVVGDVLVGGVPIDRRETFLLLAAFCLLRLANRVSLGIKKLSVSLHGTGESPNSVSHYANQQAPANRLQNLRKVFYFGTN